MFQEKIYGQILLEDDNTLDHGLWEMNILGICSMGHLLEMVT